MYLLGRTLRNTANDTAESEGANVQQYYSLYLTKFLAPSRATNGGQGEEKERGGGDSVLLNNSEGLRMVAVFGNQRGEQYWLGRACP